MSLSIPGLCECGCGELTTQRSGRPNRFVQGHYAQWKRAQQDRPYRLMLRFEAAEWQALSELAWSHGVSPTACLHQLLARALAGD